MENFDLYRIPYMLIWCFHHIVLDGWCLGALPEEDSALDRPMNSLEATEDPDGIWRRYVNDCLKETYHSLFGQLDCLVMLKAPSMESVPAGQTATQRPQPVQRSVSMRVVTVRSM